MAGRPDSEAGTDDLHQQKTRLLRYQCELGDAVELNTGTVADEREVALLQRKVWNQAALVLMLEGDDEGAAKASKQAVSHGELAVKLSKSTLADRVASLEAQVGRGRTAGKRIRDEAKRRKARG
jgi:hypothetical protein